MFGNDEIPPANEEESINNEKLRSKADYSIQWNTVDSNHIASEDENLNEIVKGFIKYYDKFRK